MTGGVRKVGKFPFMRRKPSSTLSNQALVKRLFQIIFADRRSHFYYFTDGYKLNELFLIAPAQIVTSNLLLRLQVMMLTYIETASPGNMLSKVNLRLKSSLCGNALYFQYLIESWQLRNSIVLLFQVLWKPAYDVFIYRYPSGFFHWGEDKILAITSSSYTPKLGVYPCFRGVNCTWGSMQSEGTIAWQFCYEEFKTVRKWLRKIWKKKGIT